MKSKLKLIESNILFNNQPLDEGIKILFGSKRNLKKTIQVNIISTRVVKWIAKIANCDCEEIAISQITQLNFLEGRNCENCENDEIEEFGSRFRKYLGG